MAFFVAVVLLYQFGFDWKWYVGAVFCQMAHMSFLEYRFRELEQKIEWSKASSWTRFGGAGDHQAGT